MKPRTTRETAIVCVAAVLVVALITIPFELAPDGQAPDIKGLVWIVLTAVIALGMALGFRYLGIRKRRNSS
jgi:drug/metabolite transporter (DMT)-like permease